MKLELCKYELCWLQMFWEVDFLYQEEIRKQIESATVAYRECYDNHIFIGLDVPQTLSPLPNFDSNLPLEVLVSHYDGFEHDSPVIQYGGDSVNFKVDKNKCYPHYFMLFIYGGYVREFEIYSVDSSPMNLEKIHIGHRHYRLSPDLRK